VTVKTRNRQAGAGAYAEIEAAANLAREQIGADQVLQWTLEGRCFTASSPLETASPDGQTDHDPENQDHMLLSDTGGAKLIVPISTRINLNTSAGSAEGEVVMLLGLPTNMAVAKRIASGTTMTILNNRSDGYGTQTAQALYTVTEADIDFTEIATWHFRSNAASNTYNAFKNNSVVVNHLKKGAPIILYQGASLSVNIFTGTASKVRVSFTWAELDASTYLP